MASSTSTVKAAPAEGRVETIHSTLVARARCDPDRAFLHDGGSRWSYSSLLERAELTARRLAGLGIGDGDRVVLWLPNGIVWAELFFACARLGAVVVMAGTRLRTADLRHLLEDSGAVALVFAPSFLGIDYDGMAEAAARDRAGRPLPGLRHLLTVGPTANPRAQRLDQLPAEAEPPAPPEVGAPAVVCYTSGTTGAPKGCVHSHRALVTNARVAVGLTGLTVRDRVLCPVPFAHVFGFHMGVLQATVSGATLINAEPYGADRLLDLAEAEAATVLYMVPAMAREAVVAQARHPRDLGSVRVTLLAGAPVSARLRRAVMDPLQGLGSAFTVVYGCTEAPTLTQLEHDAPEQARMSSVGRVTPGVELLICAPGSEEGLPPGETGEILCRGYNRMLGYLDDEEATAAKLRGEWLVTGDLGWLDDDGYLHFVGRADETFLVGGFNAYPREIESQLEEMDGIVEAAVTAVPDERLGSVPMALVTVEGSALEEQEIVEWGRDQMASYKRPRYVRIVGSLPRTGSGKLSRAKVEWLARRALPGLNWEDRE